MLTAAFLILPFILLAYLLADGTLKVPGAALPKLSAARALAQHTPPVIRHRPAPTRHAPPTVRRPRHRRPTATSQPETPR